jgi:hypothetical protein
MLAVFLVVAGVGETAVTASAAPSTKYYTTGVTPASVDAGVSQQSFALSLNNCGAGTAGCAKTSQQTLGSANIQVATAFGNVTASVSAPGWSVIQPVTGGLVQLRSSGVSLSPGQSVVVTVVADTPSATGAYSWSTAVKQSNDFSGSGNDFSLVGAQPQVLVGFPDHLVFATQPSTVAVTTGSAISYICPAPSVQVVSANGTPVTVGSSQVTLQPDLAFGDPQLGGTLSVAATAGLATFGAAGCSAGVDASHLGSGFRLQASATWTYGSTQTSLSTSADSSSFDVVQLLTNCAANAPCSGSASGSHTKAVVAASSATTADQLEVAIGVDSLASTTCRPANQPASLEVVRVVVDHRNKTVAMTFDKYLVNQAANNGTPLFSVCFAAPWGNWVTDAGVAPTFNTTTQEYEGVLPTCGDAGLLADNPCVASRSKNAGNETVTVSIPYQTGRADPKMW